MIIFKPFTWDFNSSSIYTYIYYIKFAHIYPNIYIFKIYTHIYSILNVNDLYRIYLDPGKLASLNQLISQILFKMKLLNNFKIEVYL